MKRRDISFIAFAGFLAISAGYTSAMIVTPLAALIGLDGPFYGGIVGAVVFGTTAIFLDRQKSN
jgi:hypothetical protein